jgi:hypothetical protein
MIGFILQESLELTLVACKLVYRGVKNIYFIPEENLLMIELTDLKERIRLLEEKNHKLALK